MVVGKAGESERERHEGEKICKVEMKMGSVGIEPTTVDHWQPQAESEGTFTGGQVRIRGEGEGKFIEGERVYKCA